MKLSGVKSVSFKGARINIVANSDNHGNLNNLPDFYNAIKQNEKYIFKRAGDENKKKTALELKRAEASTLNLYINAGDFFMNPSKKGWRSYPKKNSGDVQKEFFEKLVEKIGKVANTHAYEENEKAKLKGEPIDLKANFDAIYTPGNHCFDGGDELLYGLLGNLKGCTTVMTNVDIEASPLLKKELECKESKFKTSKVYSIPDDKNPDKKHHVMVLGATIPAMDFYNPGLLKGTNFCDTNSKKDSKMEAEDIENTIVAIKKEVDEFKKLHPKGVVILSSHMGTKLSKIVRDRVPGITEILDGHKHDVATISKDGTSISSLGMDNEIVKSISLVLDDNGDIDERETCTYSSEQYRLEKLTRNTNSLSRMLLENYKEDTRPLITIKETSQGENSFDYKPEIRYGNSYLANFLTCAVKNSIKKIKGQGDIVAVGIQSSIIRGGIKNKSNNIDILKIFDGVSEDLSDVKVGIVSGENLVKMILENISDNIEDSTRNTIIHWSDITVNRTGIAKALKINPDLSVKDGKKFIRIRRAGNRLYEPIDLNKRYKIAIADKYLKKTDIDTPKLIKDDFRSIGQTYHTLFKKYLEDAKYEINIAPKYKEDRIY